LGGIAGISFAVFAVLGIGVLVGCYLATRGNAPARSRSQKEDSYVQPADAAFVYT
jgi:hypothetical protein